MASECLYCGLPGDPCGHGQQAALNAAAPWAALANQAIIALANGGSTFTSEDLIMMVGLPTGDIGTNRNNAVGAAFAAASKAGFIHRVGTTTSKRRSSHGAMLTVWSGN